MSDQLTNFIESYRPSLEATLVELLPLSSRANTERLNEALRYALFPGGKRLRPVLTLLGANVVGASVAAALPAACAIEFLHTSSLIMDDLPGMDDATLRRGRATLHLVFGEGIALLAALALLNQAYALLARSAAVSGQWEQLPQCLTEVTDCIGANGMIGGQAADLEMRPPSHHAALLPTRNLKTAALMRLTLLAGVLPSGATDSAQAALREYGECLGTAYQIYDDLADSGGNVNLGGKDAGQDARHRRPSYLAVGSREAQRAATNLLAQAKAAIRHEFPQTTAANLLIEAADLISQRAGGRMIPPVLTPAVAEHELKRHQRQLSSVKERVLD